MNCWTPLQPRRSIISHVNFCLNYTMFYKLIKTNCRVFFRMKRFNDIVSAISFLRRCSANISLQWNREILWMFHRNICIASIAATCIDGGHNYYNYLECWTTVHFYISFNCVAYNNNVCKGWRHLRNKNGDENRVMQWRSRLLSSGRVIKFDENIRQN